MLGTSRSGPRAESQHHRLRSSMIAASAVALILVGAACSASTANTAQTQSSADSPETSSRQLVAETTNAVAVDPAAGSPTLPASFAHLSDEDTTTTSPTSSEAPAEHHFAVRYPAQDAHVDSKYLVFSGTTSPGSVVSSGEWLAEVSNDGAWSMLLVLSAGANETTFTSRGPGGVSEETVRVHLVSTTAHGSGDGSDTAVGDDDGTHFVAHQQYGSCGEAIPYDVFSGKAEPGSMVHVTSDYGSGSTLADSDGEWRVRVEFPSAPFGESFKVHVTDGAHEQKFAFTRTS